MAKPKHDPDEVTRKQERAGQTKDLKNPIAKGESISEQRAREEANRKMTQRDYE